MLSNLDEETRWIDLKMSKDKTMVLTNLHKKVQRMMIERIKREEVEEYIHFGKLIATDSIIEKKLIQELDGAGHFTLNIGRC